MSNSDSTTFPSAPLTDRRASASRRTAASQAAAGNPVSPSSRESGEETVDRSPRALWRKTSLWIRSAVAAGYGISLVVHALLLLVMSLIVYRELAEADVINTSITESEEAETFSEVMDVRLDLPQGELTTSDALETAMNLETVEWSNNPIRSGVEDSFDSLFEKQGAGGADGGGFLIPKNTKVFTKGSFSAWTVPDDPEPGEDYRIVIVVKLPDRIKRYRASDLSGVVIGTDGYRQGVPGPGFSGKNTFLPMKNNTAQLVVKVPGAASRVRDTIQIRSQTLKERQDLEIEF